MAHKISQSEVFFLTPGGPGGHGLHGGGVTGSHGCVGGFPGVPNQEENALLAANLAKSLEL